MRSPEARRFALRLPAFLPLALLVVGTSAWVDPARLLRRGEYEGQVADILASGRNASGVADYDERLAQRLYVERSARRADVLVLGSSRAMQVRQTQFPGRTLYNASVSSATLQDDVALYGLFREDGWRPSLLVLEPDPWVLNRANGVTTWRALAAEYARSCATLAIPDCERGSSLAFVAERDLELLSPRYFQASVSALLGRRGRARPPEPTESDGGAPRIRRADGSLAHERSYDAMSAELRRRAIDDFTRVPLDTLRGFEQVDAGRLAQLDALVAAAQRDGARVVLLLSPYHPDAWASLVRPGRYPIVAVVEVALRALAARHGLEVRGSYDPGKAGCAEPEFLDPVHPREICVARLVAGL